MAEDSEFAAAYMGLYADETPLLQALGSLGGKLISPIQSSANLMQSIFTGSFKNIGGTAYGILAGDLGGAVSRLGNAVSGGVASAVEVATSAVGNIAGGALRVVGSFVGGAIELATAGIGKAVQGVGGAISSASGSVGNFISTAASGLGSLLDLIPVVGFALGGIVKVVGGVVGSIASAFVNLAGMTLSVIGGAITNLGQLSSKLITSITGAIASAFESLVPILGSIVANMVRSVGGTISSLTGGLIGAIVGPARQAMAQSFTDFDRSVASALEQSGDIDSLKAALITTGEAAGYTFDQIEKIGESITKTTIFRDDDVRKAATSLLYLDRVQGDVFKRALEISADVATAWKTDYVGAVKSIGFALQDPERGMMMLRRQFRGKLSSSDFANLDAITDPIEKQVALLDLLQKKSQGAAGIMRDSLGGQLKLLARDWGEFNETFGDALLPLVSIVVKVSNAVVGTLSKYLLPVFEDLKATLQGWSTAASKWLDENSGTFEHWAKLVADSVRNVWELVSQFTASLFGADTQANAESFWQSMKSGITDFLESVRALTSNWDLMREGFGIAIDWIVAKFGDIKDSVTGWIGGVVSTFSRAFDDFVTVLRDKLADIMLGLAKAAEDFARSKPGARLGGLRGESDAELTERRRKGDAEIAQQREDREKKTSAARETEDAIKSVIDATRDAMKAMLPDKNQAKRDDFAAHLAEEKATLAGKDMANTFKAAWSLFLFGNAGGVTPGPYKRTQEAPVFKFNFAGLEDVWKKTQESITQSKMENLTEAIKTNTQRTADGIEGAVEAIKKGNDGNKWFWDNMGFSN